MNSNPFVIQFQAAQSRKSTLSLSRGRGLITHSIVAGVSYKEGASCSGSRRGMRKTGREVHDLSVNKDFSTVRGYQAPTLTQAVPARLLWESRERKAKRGHDRKTLAGPVFSGACLTTTSIQETHSIHSFSHGPIHDIKA